jgi:Hg(II)-responsive transcriptional regulator
MRTGQLAENAGVNIETLRYYERRGILLAPVRSESGYRSYPPESVDAVRFIKRAQEMGFSLAETQSLLELAHGGPRSCDRAREMAEQKLAQLEEKIASLRAMHGSLQSLVATCDLPRSQRDCSLIQSIAIEAKKWGRP